jgi:glycosyltransferase involved in cell wall biosynthesis
MQFSLITPTYNRADCIADCISSVVIQHPDFSDFEHIIIDDGSNDNTSQILEYYEKEYDFIKVIRYERNSGVNYARNRGIEKACGEYIIFLDSDDTLNPGVLKNINYVVNNKKNYKHFLFSVSSNDTKLQFNTQVTFRNLLLEQIHGDYLHIVEGSILKQNKFFEEFRAFEYLNWLRIARETQPLLAVPTQAVTVKVRKVDSLSVRIYKSSDRNALIESFEARRLFLKLYGYELKSYSVKVFYKKVLLLFLIGLRANLYRNNISLITEYIHSLLLQKLILILLNNRFSSFLVKRIYFVKNSFE